MADVAERPSKGIRKLAAARVSEKLTKVFFTTVMDSVLVDVACK
jgi:hypothetical protein